MVSGYEESRKKRLEENRKRLEELNLHALSHSLTLPKPCRPSPVSTPFSFSFSLSLHFCEIQIQIDIDIEIEIDGRPRRWVFIPLFAGRLAPLTNPLPTTRNIPHWILCWEDEEAQDMTNPSSFPSFFTIVFCHSFLFWFRVSKVRRNWSNDGVVSVEEREDAVERAEQLQSSLPPDFPAFVKPMTHSHVTRGFWLSLPRSFCNIHLPDHDDSITLVDEDGDHWETKYLVSKNGLSGGWRGFSLDHDLRDGDALVFQLTNPTSFMVYIIQVGSSDVVEKAGKKSKGRK